MEACRYRSDFATLSRSLVVATAAKQLDDSTHAWVQGRAWKLTMLGSPDRKAHFIFTVAQSFCSMTMTRITFTVVVSELSLAMSVPATFLFYSHHN